MCLRDADHACVEAKQIVKNGNLVRNGDTVRDVRDTIGVMDLVEITETGESFRVLPRAESLEFHETEDDRRAVKITGKRAEGENNIYSFHNGENYRTDEEYSTGTTLIFNDEVKSAEIAEG
ncbi:30S ribosomal protein S4e [Candidatus Haloredivivus sp. G17]|nr:30S ribosomal protein S4e [Candidatus Haloredivivus sp. G17]